jgi:hypothetical protein
VSVDGVGRGVRAFAPPADGTACPWRLAGLKPVPGVPADVAVPTDEAQGPVLHPGYGFPCPARPGGHRQPSA